MPKRIDRKRTAGWRMPKNTVYVGRPTRWGNPYPVTPAKDRDPGVPEETYYELAVDKFRFWLLSPAADDYWEQVRQELKGKDLACWCSEDKPCHADLLIQIANEE